MTVPAFAPISHDDFLADVRSLAARIRADEWAPDFLIGIGRGGLVPGVYLSHALDVRMLSIDYSSKVYGFGEQLLAEVATRSSSGDQILLVDDINDSGNTICTLREAIEAAGGTLANVRVAVMITNSNSVESVDYAARTIDRRENKDWFVFPWESVASIAILERDASEVPGRIA